MLRVRAVPTTEHGGLWTGDWLGAQCRWAHRCPQVSNTMDGIFGIPDGKLVVSSSSSKLILQPTEKPDSSTIVKKGSPSKLGMAMWLRQMRNDADNVHVCANMRKYSRIIADICIDSHQYASVDFGAWPSLIQTPCFLRRMWCFFQKISSSI